MTQIGEIEIPFESFEHVPNNPFFAANVSDIARLETLMDELRRVKSFIAFWYQSIAVSFFAPYVTPATMPPTFAITSD